jgi:hypothetical protein
MTDDKGKIAVLLEHKRKIDVQAMLLELERALGERPEELFPILDRLHSRWWDWQKWLAKQREDAWYREREEAWNRERENEAAARRFATLPFTAESLAQASLPTEIHETTPQFETYERQRLPEWEEEPDRFKPIEEKLAKIIDRLDRLDRPLDPASPSEPDEADFDCLDIWPL